MICPRQPSLNNLLFNLLENDSNCAGKETLVQLANLYNPAGNGTTALEQEDLASLFAHIIDRFIFKDILKIVSRYSVA